MILRRSNNYKAFILKNPAIAALRRRTHADPLREWSGVAGGPKNEPEDNFPVAGAPPNSIDGRNGQFWLFWCDPLFCLANLCYIFTAARRIGSNFCCFSKKLRFSVLHRGCLHELHDGYASLAPAIASLVPCLSDAPS